MCECDALWLGQTVGADHNSFGCSRAETSGGRGEGGDQDGVAALCSHH